MSSNLTTPITRELINSPTRDLESQNNKDSHDNTTAHTTAHTTTHEKQNSLPDDKLPVAISISDCHSQNPSQTCTGSFPGTYANIDSRSQHYSGNRYPESYSSTTTHYIEAPPQGSEELQKCWRYGKTIKCIAWIDAVLCFLNSFTYWPLVFLGIMPVVGYYGAKEYNTSKILVYGLYCILLVLGRILQLDMVYNDTDDNISHSDASKFIICFSIFVQLWITWIVFRLISKLKNLSDVELNTLQIGTYTPVETRIIYY